MSDQSTSKYKKKATTKSTASKAGDAAKANKAAAQPSIEGELITDAADEPQTDLHLDVQVALEENAAATARDDLESVDSAQHAASESAPEPIPSEPKPNQQAVLALGGGADAGGVEIRGLHENQVSVLQEQHAKGLIEVQRKASELKVDIQALDQTLESLTSQARSANDAGVNITATHTQNTSLGQTEIIVGNTQRAAAGKVAPLWGGLDSPQLRTGLMVGAAVLAGVLLSALFG